MFVTVNRSDQDRVVGPARSWITFLPSYPPLVSRQHRAGLPALGAGLPALGVELFEGLPWRFFRIDLVNKHLLPVQRPK